METVECARIEQQNIAFAHISAAFGNHLINVGSADIGAWFLVGDIDTGSFAIKQIEGHLVYGRRFRSRIQVAEGIYMRRAMIAHHEASGLVREPSLEVFNRLFVRMMFPYDGL